MMMEISQCCKKGRPLWIFVYQNKEVWAICKTHFEMSAYRSHLDCVIDITTRKKYTPLEIFGEGEENEMETIAL